MTYLSPTSYLPTRVYPPLPSFFAQVLLTRTQLCRLADLDAHLASKTNAGASLPWVDVSMQFAKQCVLERLGGWDDFGSIFDVLGKAAQRHSTQVARQVREMPKSSRSHAILFGSSIHRRNREKEKSRNENGSRAAHLFMNLLWPDPAPEG